MKVLWFLWAVVITVAVVVTAVSVFRPGTRIDLVPGPTPTPSAVVMPLLVQPRVLLMEGGFYYAS